jgi:peptidylprolyl isomerase
MIELMAEGATDASGTKVLLKTSMGDVTLQLYEDMPVTTGNFKKLVEKGFYDGTVFHRIIDGFMIQGGDPTGTGCGGPGYAIKDEFTRKNKNSRGTISMANAGPNTGGSQFFINLADNNYLDKAHPVFGKVVEGLDVIDAMGKVPTNASDKPQKEVKILSAKVITG